MEATDAMYLVAMYLEPREQAALATCSKGIREVISRCELLWWRIREAYTDSDEYEEARKWLYAGKWWEHFIEGKELKGMKPINCKAAIAYDLSTRDDYNQEDRDMFSYVHTQMRHVDQDAHGEEMVENHLLRGRVTEARVVIEQYGLWKSGEHESSNEVVSDELISIEVSKRVKCLIPGDHVEEFMKYLGYHITRDRDPWTKARDRAYRTYLLVERSLAMAFVNGASKIANRLISDKRSPDCICRLFARTDEKIHYPMFSTNDYNNLPKLECRRCYRS